MPSTFPTTTNVSDLLTSAGQTVGSTVIATPLAAVIAAWGNATGWNPFLLASSSTRYYDAPQGGYLELPGYAAITAVATGVVWGTDGTAGSGTAQTANYHYAPVRWRDGDTATPIVALDFSYGHGCHFYPTTYRRSIAVTGTLGWPSIPDDVWQAILEETARRVFATTQAALSGGVAKVTIGGRSVEFDSKGASGTWGENFRSTVMAYKRAVVA